MAIANWINISQSAGTSGVTTVTITASTYDQLTARTTSFRVKTVNLNLYEDVNILQNPRERVTVSVNPSAITANSDGGTYTIQITSNGDWTISESLPSGWTISQSAGTGNATITITISENEEMSTITGSIIISTIDESVTVVIKQEGKIDYSGDYLTFEILTNGTVYWKTTNSGYTSGITRTIYYSKNSSEWQSISSTTSSSSGISVSSGDILKFKGDNDYYARYAYKNYCYFSSSASFNVYGNIMSLINSTNFENLVTLPPNSGAHNYYCNFGGLFRNNSNVKNAKHLILPATTLTDSCYADMFRQCTSLITPPSLPATTLVGDCYYQMFMGCSSLSYTPVLPATSMTPSAYYRMFSDCTSITTAPNLPSTTVALSCYWGMFSGCTNLTTAPQILPATALTQSCYREMFQNCVSLTTAPELPALDVSPGSCYAHFFDGCTSLNYIKCLATTGMNMYTTTTWVGNVASSGTFVKNSAATWERGISGIPNGWTVQDA